MRNFYSAVYYGKNERSTFMTNRENALAILNYEPYDHLPIVHFGFWNETLQKWNREGYINDEETYGWWDGNAVDKRLTRKIGFDFDWSPIIYPATSIFPAFKEKVIEKLDNGMIKKLSGDGVIVLVKEGVVSIPTEVDHLMKDREGFEKYYKDKLRYSEERIPFDALQNVMEISDKENPVGLYCGSMFGQIRNWIGVEGSAYLYADDEDLFTELIDTVGDLNYRIAKRILETGAKFDFIHFWEDICFKNGPLISPAVFREKTGKHYKKITDLARSYGIGLVSLDCDGCIDSLIPTWLENGVNVMFPMEVGTWGGNMKPWREKYGKTLRGIGGMNKNVFAMEKSDVDKEIERLKPLVELGGYIPCPDHRIAPDAKFENVVYYGEQMRKAFQ